MQLVLRFLRWLWMASEPQPRDGEPIDRAFTPSDSDREFVRELTRRQQQRQLRVQQPDDGEDVKPITSFEPDCPRGCRIRRTE